MLEELSVLLPILTDAASYGCRPHVVLTFVSLMKILSQEMSVQQEMELSNICSLAPGQLLVSWLVG